MGKCAVTSQTMVVQEVGLVLFWLQREMLHLKDSLFCFVCFFLHCSEALKMELEMISADNRSLSFILTEILKEQTRELISFNSIMSSSCSLTHQKA